MILIRWVFRHTYRRRSRVIGRAAVDQPRDIRVLQRWEYLSLVAEMLKDKVRVHPAFDQLDRNPHAKFAVRTNGLIDRSHTASPDFAFDAVTTDHSADNRVSIVPLQGCIYTDIVILDNGLLNEMNLFVKLRQEFLYLIQ
jgi:hypothetical protein